VSDNLTGSRASGKLKHGEPGLKLILGNLIFTGPESENIAPINFATVSLILVHVAYATKIIERSRYYSQNNTGLVRNQIIFPKPEFHGDW
jgi:hypothetical protein